MAERERILAAYEARKARDQHRPGFFGFEDPAHMSRVHERHWTSAGLLHRHGFHPLGDIPILDVGCGNGALLRQFVEWGARPELLAGIDLRPDVVGLASRLAPGMDLRCGSATELPWADGAFALVCQHTVFTSIFDQEMRRRVADEMVRVLRDGGAILWYDFRYDNPRNSDVRAVRKRQIHALFPELRIHLQQITLAPPIARRVPRPLLPVLYPLLGAIPFLRTHYLGLFLKVSR
jgi:SAM-dependent methyltransferase